MRALPLALLAVLGGVMLFGRNAKAAELDLGSPIPQVTSTDQNGKTVDLAKAGASDWTLVYFYPKADTPGCTKQACSLRDAYAKLTDAGVKVFGVSADKVDAQKAFENKYHLPFTLLADPDDKVMDAFGVPHTMGFAKRQAFLFKDGKLVWRDLAASTDQQARDVLAAMKDPGYQKS